MKLALGCNGAEGVTAVLVADDSLGLLAVIEHFDEMRRFRRINDVKYIRQRSLNVAT